ncbi:MAG: hypothetical protein ACREN2_04810 [Candidatus Dormibacteria bacterium]
MNENSSPVPGSTARERRDQALRLRKRIVLGAATGALLTVAGLGVLAEHTVAGTTTAVAAIGSSTTDTASSNSSSANSSSANSSTSNSSSSGSTSTAPAIGRGRTSIVSGAS